jgi:hypothetical protein
MPNVQAVKLREKWKRRGDDQPCPHCNRTVAHGQDGIVSATYYCCTCGAVVLRVYK